MQALSQPSAVPLKSKPGSAECDTSIRGMIVRVLFCGRSHRDEIVLAAGKLDQRYTAERTNIVTALRKEKRWWKQVTTAARPSEPPLNP